MNDAFDAKRSLRTEAQFASVTDENLAVGVELNRLSGGNVKASIPIGRADSEDVVRGRGRHGP